MNIAKFGQRSLAIIAVLTMVFSLFGSLAHKAQASSVALWSSPADFNSNASTTGTATVKTAVTVGAGGVTLGEEYVSVATIGTDFGSGSSSLALRSDGTLWSWGSNGSGQLGQGGGGSLSVPTQIGSGTTWQSISGGTNTFYAIKTDGTLWSWGSNSSGQLGQGGGGSLSVPTQIGSATNWQSVAGAQKYALATKTDGTLWAWGDNTFGELGLGDTTQRTSPTQVGSAANWKTVAASGDSFSAAHTLAVKTDGTLWAWGDDSSNELGIGSSTAQQNSPVQVGSVNDWQSVASGTPQFDGGFSMATRTDGTLWAWGDNSSGELGQGGGGDLNVPTQVGSSTNWQTIAAGASSGFGIKSDGTLWGWGDSEGGELGLGDTSSVQSPTQIGSDTHWQAVSEAGDENGFTLATKSDGTLWAWGDNTNGELGLGSSGPITTYYSPSQVGSATNWSSIIGTDANLAIKLDGTLWGWGDNSSGQLGLGDTTTRTVPTQVGSATNWVSVATGNDHTIAVKADGTLWAWGGNEEGQLGLGTIDSNPHPTPTQVGSATNWLSVATADQASFALQANHTLWSWGENGSGELGQGDTVTRSAPTQVGSGTTWQSIAASVDGDTVLALKSDGTLWSWGVNSNGELGQGSNDDSAHPTPTQVGTDTNWVSISEGANHSLAIKSDHTLWTWGYNGQGELGQGNTTELHVPTQVGSGTTWQSTAAGVYFSLATQTNHTLWSWGTNGEGQLGLGDTATRSAPTQVGSGTTWQSLAADFSSGIALKTDHTLWTWGDDSSSELGYPNTQYMPNLVASPVIPSSGNLSGLTVNTGNGSAPIWGSLSWSSAPLPTNTSIQFEYRTSSDGITYSSYSSAYSEATLGATSQTVDLSAVPHVPYLQLMVILNSTDGTNLPTLTSMNVSYGFGGSAAVAPPVVTSFTATPAAVSPGQSVTLSWSATGAISVSVSPGVGSQPGGPTGSVVVTPATSTTYTLTIADSSGQASAQVAVAVGGTYVLSPGAVTFTPTPTPMVTPTPLPTPTPAPTVLAVSGTHPDGTLVVNSTGTVYLIRNGQLWGFRSPTEYKTWGFTFSQVVPENSADATLSSGGILKAADGSLVLDSSDNRTMYLVGGGQKMGFVSYAVYTGLGYAKSKMFTLNLSDYPAGPLVSSATAAHPVGALVVSGGTVYEVTAGASGNQLAPFTSMAVFNSYGFSTGQIVAANASDLSLPRTAPILLRDGTLVNSSGSYYVVSDGSVRPFSSLASIATAGYSAKNVVPANISTYLVGSQAF